MSFVHFSTVLLSFQRIPVVTESNALFIFSRVQLLSCHRWRCARQMRYLLVSHPLRVDLPRQHLPFGISRCRCRCLCRRCSLTKGYWIHMDSGAAVAANGAKPANRNTNTNTKHKQSNTNTSGKRKRKQQQW